ncbi:flagellar hook-associated protein FlgK [Comamonas sp. NoAH]|uniref:flagellar hook-associated protein FlgK n=1 Tax=Comamonas halotolerans TaxID=3041496 RepID=UPI0024E0E4E7|nr:flagellar hook-associated protein FlgK [Comamonas sp. NoAH]
MSLLNVGISALTSNQQALTTTGHNIANVNSKGYSRQTVITNALVGQNLGSGYIGHGVQVATVLRNYNALLGKQSNAANAASAADAIRYQSLMQMQDIYSGGDASLGAAINDMLNAFADIESAPSDASARNVSLTRMNELASRFRAANATLEELDYSTKQRISNDITVVNSLAGQVASLNAQITRALSAGHAPNDLLDARDELVREINQYVQTSQVDADDGGINLFIAGSQPLVLGQSVASLSVAETSEYPGSQKLSLYFSYSNGDKVELTANMLGGGEVAGLLKFNNEDLVEGRNLLGRMAVVISDLMNKQNQLGLTLSGEYGKPLFNTVLNGQGYSTLTDSASVALKDSASLRASDYQIVYGPNDTATLTRLSDGTKVDISNASAGFDLEFDGLTFNVPATNAQPGQSILFQPFSKAAEQMQPLVHNPDDLAVANAVTASINTQAYSTLQLNSLTTTDTSKLPALQQPLQIVFTDDQGSYQLTVGNTVYNGTFTSGSSIPEAGSAAAQALGWNITLTGTPKAGDTVTVGNAKDLGAEGIALNAGNAAAFLGLRDAAVFDSGTLLSDGFSAAMAVVGTRTQSAKLAAQLSETVANNLNLDRTSVSGVNLDEEAARLLQYQQAYQASAKVIQTAQSLFDSVLNAVGR